MTCFSAVRSALRPGGAAVLVAVLCAGTAAAQSPPLGEVARKEAERRKAQPPAGKVYTNKDLPAAAQGRAPVPSTDPPASVAPEPAAPLDTRDAASEPPVRDEAWWKARMVEAREELRRNEMFAESLQSRINALSRDFVNRDDPAQRARIGEERGEALVELARVRQEIERGSTQIEDLEEEARKAGVPPGWLR